ncbi:MAG TPA: DNA adenine methylase [Pyrinomonadaceae bacterium]|jgi:DNA adenine methylase
MSNLNSRNNLFLPFAPNDPEMEEPVVIPTPQKKRAKRNRNDLLQPFLKWAGGKRQLLSYIREQVPKKYNKYFEPFIGGGAVLFDLQPDLARISDINEELINCYEVIRDTPDELLEHIDTHQNTEEYFYELRGKDREPDFKNLSKVERASRIIFLNKTCFNGLFRVNSRGQFNVPYGNYKNPGIADKFVIKAISNYLKNNQIEIKKEDFHAACETATKNDFIYFDPPYDPVSDTASFTGYSLDKFDREEQTRLKELVDDLTNRGVKVLLSNSDTPFIRELYKDERYYVIDVVYANRNINSVASGRGKISEVLIRNKYELAVTKK